MHIGIFAFNTAEYMLPQDIARAVEARGFESLWFPEHTHIPTSRQSLFFGSEDLPDYYSRFGSPFVGLSAAAATTKYLKLGTSICLIAQYDPIILAKLVASLDVVSNGRFQFGVGFGWNAEEMANHGITFSERFDVTEEKIDAIKTLWGKEEAAFHGHHVNFEHSWQEPKPLQKPHPPILLGAGPTRKSLRILIEHCDGWMPMVPMMGIDGFLSALAQLRQQATDAGRNPNAWEISPTGLGPDESTLERFAKADVDRVILNLPYGPRDQVLPLLDAWAPLLKKFA